MIEHLTDRQVIALRTQSVQAGEAFPLLEHAATCAVCSERLISRNEMALEVASLAETLRGAVSHLSLDEMNDLVDGSLRPHDKARLDEHLTACSSCSGYVLELTKMSQPVPLSQPEQGQWFANWMGTFFTRPGMMMGAAAMILLAVGLSGWGMLRHRVAEPQSAALSTLTTRPAKGGKMPTKSGSQTVGQADNKPSPDSKSLSAQSGKTQGSILAIALMPGIVRGDSAVRTVHLPLQLDTLLITLTSRAELTGGRYRVSLTDVAGRSVWRNEVEYRRAPEAVVVRVPAKLLAAGSYVVTLAVADGAGTGESLEEYGIKFVR